MIEGLSHHITEIEEVYQEILNNIQTIRTGKRGPLNSETYASTSDNINPVKARRISTNVRDGNYNHLFINKPNEVEEIRNILNDKNNQLDKLNDKIERLTVLLWNKNSNNNEKEDLATQTTLLK